MTAHEPAAAFRTDATAAASATLLLPAGPVTATRRESDASSTFPSLAARRPHRPVRRAGRAGEGGGRRRLRLLVAGHVHPRDPPDDRVGQIRGAGGGRAPGHGPALVSAAPGKHCKLAARPTPTMVADHK